MLLGCLALRLARACRPRVRPRSGDDHAAKSRLIAPIWSVANDRVHLVERLTGGTRRPQVRAGAKGGGPSSLTLRTRWPPLVLGRSPRGHRCGRRWTVLRRPLNGPLSAKELRLVLAVRSATGIEARVWLTDIAGLPAQEATELTRWTAHAIYQSALEEATARRQRAPKRSDSDQS